MSDRKNSLDNNKYIKFPDNDPRFGFTIKDSDEFNETIRPLQIEKKCNRSCKLRDQLNKSIPMINRCWGQRYENCVDINTMHNEKCLECDYNVRSVSVIDPEELDWTDEEPQFKKLNNNVIYDQTRISKVLHPDIVVNNSYELNEGFDSNNILESLIDPKILVIICILLLILLICN